MKSQTVEINGLLWNKDNLYSMIDFNENSHLFLYDNEIIRLPVEGVDINFHCDIWDFSSVDLLERPRNLLFYDFSSIYIQYKSNIKKIIFNYIINKKYTFSTIKEKFTKICYLVKFLEDKHIINPEMITYSVVKDYIGSLNPNYNEETKNKYKYILEDLLKSIELKNNNIDFRDIYVFLAKTNTNIIRAQREKGKTENIPKDMFSMLITCAVNDIKNPESSSDEIRYACVVLLLSQIGMRIGELRIIEIGKKNTVEILNGIKAAYLEFKTYKTIEGDGEFKWTKTYLTPYAELAYDALVELSKAYSGGNKPKYLFTNYKSKEYTLYSKSIISNMILLFTAKHHNEISCINRENAQNEGLRVFEIMKGWTVPHRYKLDLKEMDKLCSPTAHQFRVAVCNALIHDNGIQIDWVREHMNHLTFEMTEHYIRMKEEKKKDQEIAAKVLRGIVKKDIKLIGKEANVLHLRINEFIMENNFDVKTDVEAIVNELKQKVPIREKREGFCIKSSFGRKCPTNEYECAFDFCPNHCVFFGNIDITYNRFKDKQKIIAYNLENGFVTEAKAESNKLRRMVVNNLVPEIGELKHVVKKQGVEKVISEYEHLIPYINDIEKIKQEVRVWIQKIG